MYMTLKNTGSDDSTYYLREQQSLLYIKSIIYDHVHLYCRDSVREDILSNSNWHLIGSTEESPSMKDRPSTVYVGTEWDATAALTLTARSRRPKAWHGGHSTRSKALVESIMRQCTQRLRTVFKRWNIAVQHINQCMWHCQLAEIQIDLGLAIY